MTAAHTRRRYCSGSSEPMSAPAIDSTEASCAKATSTPTATMMPSSPVAGGVQTNSAMTKEIGVCRQARYTLQVMALSCNTRLVYPPQDVLEKTFDKVKPRPHLPNRNGELAWPALLRKLDRADPSYRN